MSNEYADDGVAGKIHEIITAQTNALKKTLRQEILEQNERCVCVHLQSSREFAQVLAIDTCIIKLFPVTAVHSSEMLVQMFLFFFKALPRAQRNSKLPFN